MLKGVGWIASNTHTHTHSNYSFFVLRNYRHKIHSEIQPFDKIYICATNFPLWGCLPFCIRERRLPKSPETRIHSAPLPSMYQTLLCSHGLYWPSSLNQTLDPNPPFWVRQWWYGDGNGRQWWPKLWSDPELWRSAGFSGPVSCAQLCTFWDMFLLLFSLIKWTPSYGLGRAERKVLFIP